MPTSRELIDQAARMTEAERSSLRRAARINGAAASPLGLKFVAGARVLDLASGFQGTVREADRDSVGVGGVYRVELTDGRSVWRVDTELEPVRTAAGMPS